MKTDRPLRLRERGASLVEYSLIFALVTVVSIVAIQSLERNSEQYLEDSGDSIGDARPTKLEIEASISLQDPNP